MRTRLFIVEDIYGSGYLAVDPRDKHIQHPVPLDVHVAQLVPLYIPDGSTKALADPRYQSKNGYEYVPTLPEERPPQKLKGEELIHWVGKVGGLHLLTETQVKYLDAVHREKELNANLDRNGGFLPGGGVHIDQLTPVLV